MEGSVLVVIMNIKEDAIEIINIVTYIIKYPVRNTSPKLLGT